MLVDEPNTHPPPGPKRSQYSFTVSSICSFVPYASSGVGMLPTKASRPAHSCFNSKMSLDSGSISASAGASHPMTLRFLKGAGALGEGPHDT